MTTVTIAASNSDEELHSSLALTFDHPISKKAADAFRSSLTDSFAATSALGPTYLSCDGSGNWGDSNGTLSLQYSCFTSSPDVLAWGYKISPATQAIIVGGVNESGLRWWRNLAEMPKNAPHPGYPKNYQFHGSMNGANTGTTIDYQDYLTFRHNLGGGGTGSITWAGRVNTLAD